MKLKALIKRPDEKVGHMTAISTRLENLQNIVGGYIENITIDDKTVMLVNEEGKLLGLEPNIKLPRDIIVGDLIVIGYQGDELTDLTIDMATWKAWLKEWGNDI